LAPPAGGGGGGGNPFGVTLYIPFFSSIFMQTMLANMDEKLG